MTILNKYKGYLRNGTSEKHKILPIFRVVEATPEITESIKTK